MNRKEMFDKAIGEVASELTTAERNTVKEISRKIRGRYDVTRISKELMKGHMEENSFLDPIYNEENRTTKSVPRKGFTSISRIAKG